MPGNIFVKFSTPSPPPAYNISWGVMYKMVINVLVLVLFITDLY